jgi:sulfatase modifying factor 1
MSESQPPKRPSNSAGGPLPRLWKAQPDPSAEEEPKTKKKKGETESAETGKVSKKSKSGKDSKKSKDSAEKPKGVLIEETPRLETYEARQTVRIVMGAAFVGLFVLVLFILIRVLSPPTTEEVSTPVDSGIVATPSGGPAVNEEEARHLYDRAHEVARTGNAKLAVSMLTKVTTAYPKSKAAADAREALDRPGQNLPLFLDTRTVLASQSASTSSFEPKKKEEMVVATAAVAPGAATSDARLVLPANPAERGRSSSGSPSGAEKPTRPLPAGFQPRPGSDVHSSGWPIEIVGDRDGAPMVLVPGGTFIMGRDDGEPAEGPAHKVTVTTFYVDQHEVTNRQFDLLEKEMGKRAERAKVLSRDPNPPNAAPDWPVVMVNASEAKAYATWAGKRIPTEAQWEMAARGVDGRLYPWGPSPPGKERPARAVEAVQSFLTDVSPYGAYDMAGNAWEWTRDWFDPRYFHLFRTTTADNPRGPANRPHTLQLTIKGNAKNWIVTKREGMKYETRLPLLGFRCVLPVEGPDNAFQPAGTTTSGPAPGQPAAVGQNGVVPF